MKITVSILAEIPDALHESLQRKSHRSAATPYLKNQ